MKVYVFRKYSTVYRDFFRLEKRRLAALGTGLSVEHIGSTAVSGLGGKNILDIAIGCREGLSKTKKALEGLGYEFMPVREPKTGCSSGRITCTAAKGCTSMCI